jgi:DNA-binding transcriptional LysR family regulator
MSGDDALRSRHSPHTAELPCDRRALNVTIAKLCYFVTVAREQSFTRAALRLFVTQSALSQQIKSLERDVGAELFDRTHRAVRLTMAGQAFLPYAEGVLELLAAGLTVTRDVDCEDGASLGGRLVAGSSTTGR